MQSEPSSGIKLTAYSCICWLFHIIYYDARNHEPKIQNTMKYTFLVDKTHNPFTILFQIRCVTRPCSTSISWSSICSLTSRLSDYKFYIFLHKTLSLISFTMQLKIELLSYIISYAVPYGGNFLPSIKSQNGRNTPCRLSITPFSTRQIATRSIQTFLLHPQAEEKVY